jgi:hypothetical protein
MASKTPPRDEVESMEDWGARVAFHARLGIYRRASTSIQIKLQAKFRFQRQGPSDTAEARTV